MKILIIPDVHEQVEKLETILAHYNKYVDRVIFLGDYFDKFGETSAQEMVDWLDANLDTQDFTFLMGNHDQHYVYGIERCGGYRGFTQQAINPILPKLKAKLKPMEILTVSSGIWLFSHAGLTNQFHIPHRIEKSLKEAMSEAEKGKLHPLFAAGIDRGGTAITGGITWCDWDNFEPIKGFNQVCGHTQDKNIRIKVDTNSINYCIDTALNHVMVIDKKEIEIIGV